MSDPHVITMLCTGNAARSVMAAALLRDRLAGDPRWHITSAGTLVLPGQPMSVRTRRALERHDLRDPWHRSRQLGEEDAAAGSLILAMEDLHVRWIERTMPSAVPITGMLRRVVAELPALAGSFDERVAALGLAGRPIEPWEEIVDPGGGEQDAFDHCVDELATLIDALAITLAD